MADLLTDVINHIISHGLAVSKDSDIFKDFAPKLPDDAIMVYEYGGSEVAQFVDISVRSVQIMTRSKTSQTAKQKAWEILKVLNPETGILMIGTRNCIVSNRNTPMKLGVDEQNRYLYAFNLGITTNFD